MCERPFESDELLGMRLACAFDRLFAVIFNQAHGLIICRQCQSVFLRYFVFN